MKIYLASQSKYKIRELKKIIPQFHTIDPKYDEDPIKSTRKPIAELVLTLASDKAWAAYEILQAQEKDPFLIISTDQICHLIKETDPAPSSGPYFYSKPKTHEKAFQQLSELSGKTHYLSTGVTIIGSNKQTHQFISQTALTMKDLSPSQISRYLEREQPFDCAGSYKIESFGINLFSEIKTPDFTGIIGIPLMQVSNCLNEVFKIDLLSI